MKVCSFYDVVIRTVCLSLLFTCRVFNLWCWVCPITAEITRPTDIQSRAIPIVQAGSNILMAGQTGTGKTLAYLLPLIERLKRDEHAGFDGRASRPRVVILAPTRELAQQVGRVCKALSHRVCVSLLSFSL